MLNDNPIPLLSDTELSQATLLANRAVDSERLPEVAADLLYELQQKTGCRNFADLLDVLETETTYRKNLAAMFAPKRSFDMIGDWSLAVAVVGLLAAGAWWFG